jgi:5-(carboxyamino)imidazole ribonucleotide synthase
MFNLIGIVPNFEMLLRMRTAHVHWYGKEPREGRKLGHVTIRADSDADYGRDIALAAAIIAP